MPSVPNSGSAAPPPPPVWDARPPETAVRYAGFWIRVIAAIIDSIALWILWQIVGLFFPAPPSPPTDPDLEALVAYMDALMTPAAIAAYAVLVWAYFALQESSSAQATLGKRLMGIGVSTEQGARLSLGAATVRSWPMYLPTVALLVGTWLSTLVVLLAVIACVAVAFSARKQGLHDRMAGAVVTWRR